MQIHYRNLPLSSLIDLDHVCRGERREAEERLANAKRYERHLRIEIVRRWRLGLIRRVLFQ